MEDYILREIDKIGKLIEAILNRMGGAKKTDEDDDVCETAKIELLDGLNLDIDTLLENSDFIDVLITEYGFSNANLDKFAELLFDLAEASQDRADRVKLSSGIGAIYTYLDRNKADVSLNRYYILKELNKYI